MTISPIKSALAIAALCIAAAAGAQTPAQPTGTTGATAFNPHGASKGEADASTGANAGAQSGSQSGSAGSQSQAKPGFDNKPPKGEKEDCQRPQGGVDASGGENITTAASKHNTTCTGSGKSGKAGKSAKADKSTKN